MLRRLSASAREARTASAESPTDDVDGTTAVLSEIELKDVGSIRNLLHVCEVLVANGTAI